MNYDTDAKQFAVMMKITWQSYGRNGLDKETMRYWFDKLYDYEFNAVSHAFDEWLKSQKDLPTVNEIIKLCQHKVTIYARLPSPLSIADNKRHADEVVAFVENNIKPAQDKKQWARDLVSGKKVSNWYKAVDFAKEALNAK